MSQNTCNELPEQVFDLPYKTAPQRRRKLSEKALHPLSNMYTFTNRIIEAAVLQEGIREQELPGQE